MKYLLILFALVNTAAAQQGRIIRFTSAHSMFPDTARAAGHDYNGKHYDAATHYSDSSVFIYVPSSYKPSRPLHLVFWFHGWGNNIDSALAQYRLLEQFSAAGRNAVFIFPEGPKNAPDSYGGKLEQPEVFKGLVADVCSQLGRKKFNIDKIMISLAGHSGAYRVISRILNKTPVQEVILFDAMYGGNDQYLEWLSNPDHRFINIYTKDGGTFENSHFTMQKLTDSLHVPFLSVDEDALTEQQLRSNNKLFIYSNKAHNEVITNRNNWERFLRFTP